jgi:hypothetical protein
MSLPLIGPLTLPTFFFGFLILILFRWFNRKNDPEPEVEETQPEKLKPVEAKTSTDNGHLKSSKLVDIEPKENGIRPEGKIKSCWNVRFTNLP